MNRFFNLKIAVLALALLVCAFTFWRFKYSRKAPNIIVILIDTLRADHLGAFGYERNISANIDKLAAESLNFSRAIAAASWTAPSVTSILSGLYPTAHTNQPPKRFSTARQLGNKIPENVHLIQQMLKQRDYQTAAISSNPWVSKDFDFDKGFDRFYYAKHINAGKIVELGKKEIELFVKDPSNPFFLYLHFIDPHEPYLPHPDFTFEGNLKSRQYSEEMMKKINLYDGEIQYTDTQLGIFFDYLRNKGLYDNSVIVLVSDHGEAFEEHGIFGHGFNLNIEEVHVPLFIKGLGTIGKFDDTVSHVDIVPTLLDLAGIEKPKVLMGQSLLDLDKVKARTGIYSETYRVFRQRAFSTTAGERLIVEMGDTTHPKHTMTKRGVYDLVKDPYELNSIEDASLDAELQGYLESMIAKNQPVSKPQEVKIPDKTLEQLETLGYIN